MNKIVPIVRKFDPKKCIPQSWRIPSSGQHFYRYVFSQYRNGCTDRSKLYHPLFVFIIIFIMNLRFMYSVAIPPQTTDFHLIIGDFGYFIGMQFHMNLMTTLFFWIAIISINIHFYEYLSGRGQP